MPERGRFTLLTIRGIPIGVDWTWFFILFLIIWLLSGFYRDVLGTTQDSIEPYALAVASAFGFFASILLHELGHAVIAVRNKIGISQITLWMFGGVASLDREPDSAGAEFRIAAAGPAVTLLITAACLGAGAAIDGSTFWDGASFDENATISTGVAVLAWLANINAAILIFNLLPAFPLDGGRIARAIVWKLTGNRERATIFAARLGQGFAYAFIAIGILIALGGSLFAGVWLALIGWMLGGSARATAERSKLNTKLGDLRVADVMDAEPVAIPERATVEQALDEYFLRYRWPWFPVVDAGQRFVGLLNRGTADAVPETSRTSQTVGEIIDPGGSTDQTVSSDEPLEALLANLELRRLGGLVAIDADGRLTGVITLEQVGRALRDAAA
ncbi:MAG TPA: site-2 protease family protein [Solirubrobacterales bacterium]|jgi:Zn-dependent protease|nr:site-2 protease family protein [Solirubrobacterales bacterium]